MKSAIDSDQDYTLWLLLRQACDASLRARDKELSQYGISVEEAAVLFVVQSTGERATPSEISRWLFREPHSTSGLIIRMEKDGLVTKVADLERKNMLRVVMTDKGREAYEKSTARETIHRMMSSLSQNERQVLRSCMERLRNEAVKELRVERKPPPFP
jgi:DNA-binding MarR family transcriptional regulator